MGLFHSGEPSPIHLIAAALAIVGGNLATLSFPEAATRIPRTVLGLFGLACVLMLVLNDKSGPILFPDGVWERCSVYAITAFELFTAARGMKSAAVSNV